MRTLVDRRQQGFHEPWLRRARAEARALDLDPLLALHPMTGFVPDFLTPPPRQAMPSFSGELERVRQVPLERVRAEIARSLDDRPRAQATPDLVWLLEDPQATLDRLVASIEAAWQRLVAPYWPSIRDLLEDDIRFHARRLADGGMERLFAELHPHVRWSAGSLRIRMLPSVQRDLEGAGLVLMPSVFTWPALVVILDPPWQPTLVYPARGIDRLWRDAISAPADALARLVGRTRAVLLAALDKPASTTALAQRHRLSPGTVSAHLAILRDAGLVESRREGHEVLYERAALGDALLSRSPP